MICTLLDKVIFITPFSVLEQRLLTETRHTLYILFNFVFYKLNMFSFIFFLQLRLSMKEGAEILSLVDMLDLLASLKLSSKRTEP